MKMTITGWTNWFDDNRYSELPNTAGTVEDAKAAVAEELRKRGYKFTGDYHQNGEFGVPIIDGIWLYKCSQRHWGHLMTEAYPDEIDNSDGRGYVQWAWMKPDGQEMITPNPEDYK